MDFPHSGKIRIRHRRRPARQPEDAAGQADAFYEPFRRALTRDHGFLQITLADLTVIHDDIDLAPGKIRLKVDGGMAAITVCGY